MTCEWILAAQWDGQQGERGKANSTRSHWVCNNGMDPLRPPGSCAGQHAPLLPEALLSARSHLGSAVIEQSKPGDLMIR